MNIRNIVKSIKTGVVQFTIQKLQKLREYNVQAHIEIEDKKFTRIESELKRLSLMKFYLKR